MNMWQIREEQIEALEAAACGRFLRACVAHLRDACPVETAGLSDLELRRTIGAGVARANRHGITSERDVTRFTELMLRLGADFDTRPDGEWARAVLWDRTLDGSAKMRRVCAAAAARGAEVTKS